MKWIYTIFGGAIFLNSLFQLIKIIYYCITLPYDKWETEAAPDSILMLIISFQILKTGIKKFKKTKIETEIIDRF